MQSKNIIISNNKNFTIRQIYEIPERYRNAFYLANAALFDSVNWFMHQAYEIIFPDLKNTYRHEFKNHRNISDSKIHGKLENCIEILDQCNSIIDIRFPVKRENGNWEIIRGFRAHYGEILRNSPCLGGLRIHHQITRDQMKAFSLLSFIKNSCIGTNLSGAVGGIKINPKNYTEAELKTIIQLYVAELVKKGYCNNSDITHPDFNSGEQEMNFIHEAFQKFSGSSINAIATGKSVENGGVEIFHKATAFGAYKALEFFINNGEVMLRTGSIKTGFKNKRFIIEGLGKVGKNLGNYLVEAGAICVGVKDENMYLFDAKGIDFNELLKHKLQYGNIEHFGLAKTEFPDSIFQEECDILVLAGLHKSLQCYIAKDVKARLILEAADVPVTPTAHKILTTKSRLVIPDIFSCAGSNVISYFEYLRNLQQIGMPIENLVKCTSGEMNYGNILNNTECMRKKLKANNDGASQVTAYNVFLPLNEDFVKNSIDCIYQTVGEDIFKKLEYYKLGCDLRSAAYIRTIENNFNTIFEEKILI